MNPAARTCAEKIWQLAEPLLEAEGMELIHVECLKAKSRWIVRIYMDKEGGVTIDDCAEISNQLGDVLDVHDVPPGAYTMEVSSPGLDRPLTKDKDFLKYRGSKVRVTSSEKLEGIKNFRGKLVDFVEEDGRQYLAVEMAGKIHRIPKDLVVKANLEYEP
jgi:ribosome maturation factor RimP